MTEQINELFPRLGSCFEDTLTEMIEKKVNDNIQSIVEQTLESLNQNPPEWFTNEMREIKKDIKDLKGEFKDLKRDLNKDVKDLKIEFKDLKRDLNKDVKDLKIEFKDLKRDVKRDLRDFKGDMYSGFKMSEYSHIRLYNMFRRMNGYPATPVPFLNVEAIMNELPPIGSVQDIDSLSKEECQTYLRAYNVEFHPNESVKLKERLRDAVGLAISYDLEFQFGSFQ